MLSNLKISTIIFLGLWLLSCVLLYSSLPKPLFSQDAFSTMLYDRDDKLLSARISKDEQWHFPASDSISQKYYKALIHFEDKRFYQHAGFDVLAIAKASIQNIRAKRIIRGASTLTMQVIRLHQGNPSRTFFQKFKEIILAHVLEWKYSKQEIIKMYAEQAPFGGNVIGIDAACWRYFGKDPTALSWSEAALLAVLPNNPGHIHTERNRKRLKIKRNNLLAQLFKAGFIDEHIVITAQAEDIPRRQKRLPNLAPQALDYLKQKNQQQIFRSTINQHVQLQCLNIAQNEGAKLKQNHIDNLAILVLDIEKNEVLAYVGNLPNTGVENQQDVDMVQANRSTGSLLKPFLFAASLDEGILLESTLVQDMPAYIDDFLPKNFNKKYSGLVPMNLALQRSLNVPFARLLQSYNIEKFRRLCQKLGLRGVNKSSDHYGLPLILGGAESSLWDMTNAYAYMGKTIQTYHQSDAQYNERDLSACNMLQDSKTKETDNQANPVLLRAENIWITLNNLRQVQRPSSDGAWEQFKAPQQLAWKTGTSNGYKDAWAIGVNTKYAIGVWVGNADGEGRAGIIGTQAAAPILFRVLHSLPDQAWFEPCYDDLEAVAICQTSGFRPTNHCPTDTVYVSTHKRATASCPYHETIFMDETEQYQVYQNCYPIQAQQKKRIFKLTPKIAHYYKNDYVYTTVPPLHPDCRAEQKEQLSIVYPTNNIRIYQPKLGKGRRSSVVLRAAHQDPNAVVYWHLNKEFIGTSKEIHEIKKQLAVGKHRLLILDQQGNQDQIDFEIVQ